MNIAKISRVTFMSLFTIAGVGAFTGCESGPQWKQSDEKTSLTSGGLDMQNFNNTASDIATQMFASPRVEDELSQAAQSIHARPLIKVSRIKNSTNMKINLVDVLVAPIEEAIVNSGKADFFSEDQTAQDIRAASDLTKKYGSKIELPDFTVYGAVTQLHTDSGSAQQNAYMITLRMTNNLTNREIFLANKQVYKQGRR